METPHFKAWRAASPEFVAERKVEIVTPEKIDRP
jgi:quinol monooxygenase YgiN